MNRKILYIFIFALFISSCEDQLELEPENSVTFPSYFNDDTDMQSVLMEINNHYRHAKVLNGLYPVFQGTKADKKKGDFGLYSNLDPSRIKSTSSVCSWKDYYTVITWCNILLENIYKAELVDDRRDFYNGAAYFYRALSYFNLVQIWRDVPIIPNSTFGADIAKSDWKKVIDYALADCNKAVELLVEYSNVKDAAGANFGTKQIASKGAAYALMTHLYAWKGSLTNDNTLIQKAIDAATALIDSPNKEYSLAANPEEYITKAKLELHPEVIFEVDCDPVDLGSNITPFSNLENLSQKWPWDGESREGQHPYNFFGLLNTTVESMYEAGDLRRDAYFYKFDELKTNPIFEGYAVQQTVRKAIISDRWGYDEFEAWNENAIIYRLSGLILLRAECYAKIGKNSSAINDLNTVRARSNAKLYDPSEDAGNLYKTIFLEREKELLYERHRWFDCIRTGFWKTELNEKISAITQDEFDQGALFYPVYYLEMETNKLMRQNTYWLSKE
ncbi:MAG: RagB/SusD family nutrient uptake outer membrane protein [Marinifilaceae bacterium]|nr:RagB/SusD family nutrient uptake outer membrane protein [Marinifilaceae bacterium]